MKEVTDIVIMGVGGQGIILATTILSEVALYSGFDVKTNEVHGMAQRGGSVISQIRFGEKVYSPLVKNGEAELFIGLEKLEALRGLRFCNKDTVAIINNREIYPITVSSGSANYPKDADRILKENINKLFILDAEKIALDVGNIKTENVVMLGAASNFLPFETEHFEKAIKNLVKQKYVDVNIAAFYKGRDVTNTNEQII